MNHLKYSVLFTDGKTNEYVGAACFASLRTELPRARGVTYYPILNVTEEEARDFLRKMKKIGFAVGERVLDCGKYTILFGKAGIHGTDTWIGGNLTVVRYLDEFARVVRGFLSLCTEFPFIDNWKLFQFAHSQSYNPWPNDNHSLMPFNKIGEFTSWQHVNGMLRKRTKHAYSAYEGWGIHAAFSPEWDHGHIKFGPRAVQRKSPREELNELLQKERGANET